MIAEIVVFTGPNFNKQAYHEKLLESKQPRILWLNDKAGWAFHNNAMNIARQLGHYDHFVIIQNTFDIVLIEETITEIQPNIVMIQHPWGFKLNKRLKFPMAIRLACRSFRVWPNRFQAYQL
jgi:hypothetical protein